MKQEIVLPASPSRVGVIGRVAMTLGRLAGEKLWKVTIEEYKPRRSTQQNRYLWGLVYPTIAQHLQGWDTDDIHEYFLGECFGWETLEGLGRKRIKPLKRSSRLNKQEFADYIDFIQRRASEHGIFIPDADPDYYLHEQAA